MFRILLKNIFRGSIRQYKITLINLSGLVLAFTALLFIQNYVLYEKSFDSFFNNSENIYRITNSEFKDGEEISNGAKTPRGLFFSRDEIPEIEALSQARFESCQVKYENEALFEQKALWVEKDFEKVFDFKMITGLADFSAPLTGIISNSKARTLFGDENPIGKIIKLNDGWPISITGVYEDLPSNTHLEADYLLSAKTWVHYGLTKDNVTQWLGNAWWTYIRTRESADLTRIENALRNILKKHQPNSDFRNRDVAYSLQPLHDIHFDLSKDGDLGKKTSRTSVLMVTLFGIFIVLAALINYINLSIATAIKRETTFGIQSLIGAKAIHRITQVFIDNFLMNCLAALIAWFAFKMLEPPFASVFEIPFTTAYIPAGKLLFGFLWIFVVGFIVSSLLTLLPVLKIKPFIRKSSIRKNGFQRGLVVAQLIITFVFISSSILIRKQLNYVQNYNIGASMEQVVTLSGPTSFNKGAAHLQQNIPKIEKFRTFQQQLLKNPEIVSGTATYDLFGKEPFFRSVPYRRTVDGNNLTVRTTNLRVDNGFIETYGLKLLAGNVFSNSMNDYFQKIILSESAMRKLQFENPESAVGNILRLGPERQLEIVGVVEDFHFEGLKKENYPIVLDLYHPSTFGYYSFKLRSANMANTIQDIKKTWNKIYPDDPFNCFFQDEYYNQQYLADQQFSRFNLLFTIVSIFISCMGLYTMINFYIIRKTKEIGVRKINGAKVKEVLAMLNADFIKWVAIAFFVASPIAWYAMTKWLQNFAYKTEISWWVFALAGTISLVIALFTVSWQSWKAASRNPVEALRYE